MFEDSTFESTGRIKTRSRRWMFATFTFNGSILVTLVLLPFVYPGALPQHMLTSLLVAPEVPKPPTPPEPDRVRATPRDSVSEIEDGRITAPPQIPTKIRMFNGPEPPFPASTLAMDGGPAAVGPNGANPFSGPPAVVVHKPSPSTLRLPSRLVESTVIYKTIPQYPAIAKATHTEGTVVLQAMISKSGTIEGLHVISGSPMLQQAAIDAVKTWRYRPYLLNDQPVEVETTVNVIFKLGS